MTVRTVKVKLPLGLETRPVAMLVRTASEFEGCTIHLENEAKRVNAKSIMGMMTLGLNSGLKVVVTADGPDEAQAVDGIEAYLS